MNAHIEPDHDQLQLERAPRWLMLVIYLGVPLAVVIGVIAAVT